MAKALRAKIGTARIAMLVEAATARHQVTGPDERGVWWVRKPNGTGFGYDSEARALRERGKLAAILVLEENGLSDWHDYDWHLWADDPVLMVTEIVRRDLEMRKAAQELEPIHALINAMIRRRPNQPTA